MTMTDPIADMLTRIRNANTVKHETVDVPASNIKKEIVRILLEEGFVRGYDVIEDEKQGIIRIQLKYGQSGERVIQGVFVKYLITNNDKPLSDKRIGGVGSSGK